MLIIHILYGFKLKAEDRKSLQHVKNNLILNITLTKYYIEVFDNCFVRYCISFNIVMYLPTE